MNAKPLIAASTSVAGLWLALCGAAAADTIGSFFDAVDGYNDKIITSNRLVRQAMDEGGPRARRPDESTGQFYLRRYRELDKLYRINDGLLNSQQKLLNDAAKQLLNPNLSESEKAKVKKTITEVSVQQAGTRKARNGFLKQRKEFHDAIQDYRTSTGSYPPHDCLSAPGWHLPTGAKCSGAPADVHAESGGHGH